jgi:tetratricopeptide (TPR) repeat protein
MSPFRPSHRKASKPPSGGFFIYLCLAEIAETVYKREILTKRPPMKKTLPMILLLVSMIGSLQAAYSEPTESDPAWLTEARTSIKSEKYDQAVKQLQAANETSSADWNNLLGYSLRKKQPPDLLGAEKYYQAALKINPRHRGALEYYGELKLMNNDLPGAEALLARLDKACTFGCEEYSDLKAAIQKYKSRK